MTHDCSCHGADKRLSQTESGALERPRYAPGLILEDADLTAAVDYTRELNRLMFRSLFGCGVVCGLTVGVESDCGLEITIEPGLALDGCGDPLQLTRPVRFTFDNRDHFPRRGAPKKTNFWIIACSREKTCRPRPVVCDIDDLQDVPQPTRTRATIEISISEKRPECVCGCRRFDAEAEKDFDLFARSFFPESKGGTHGEWDEGCCADPYDCHKDHRERVTCAPDCGCGTACSSGCCVLLAWVHWYKVDGHKDGGEWGVLHNGVRRFIRPGLLPDPMARIDALPQDPLKVAPPEEERVKPNTARRRAGAAAA